jgi:hypothetical protein
MNYDDSLKWRKYHDMRKVYKRVAWQEWHTLRRHIFHSVVRQPYPYFYITAEYCVKMFRWKESGNRKIDSMLPPTRRKLEHLYARYLALKEERPDAPKIEICSQIVEEPAPELFMTGDSAYNFYLDMQRKERLLNKLKEIPK